MASSCVPERRCRRRDCDHCGPIREADEWRKFDENLRAYGGPVAVVAVTAPGADLLPWACDKAHRHSGKLGCRVDRDAARWWNATASERYARLWKAATIAADRVVRRLYRGAVMPRRVAVVWSEQARGVWHVHEALPMASEVEKVWSRTVVSFLDVAQKREGRMDPNERELLLELERCFGLVTRGFYGWGFVDRNPMRADGRATAEQAARYLARNAARYLAENAGAEAAEPLGGRRLRSYVSRRLTTRTGVTMLNLRRKRYLWMCVTKSEPLPDWPDDVLERVWSLLADGVGAARAP